jgi:NADPH:quinone reductase-like Zn-dependent oxidoreductase
MKAIVQDKYGPPDVLELREVDKPGFGDGDVSVRVHAASVNPADHSVMTGKPFMLRMVYGLAKPRNGVRGTDVAGTVEAVGEDVQGLKPGDEVFGWCKGSFAEFVSAAEDNFVLKPINLSFEEAAAVPMAAGVALQALRDKGEVKAGQKILVNGASGGIGTFAVQIGKAFGAEVTGVCSTPNVELVGSIGADHVIDYTTENFTEGDNQYDFILDNVENHSLSRLRRVLAPRGTLVPNHGTRTIRSLLLSPFLRQRLRPFLSLSTKSDLVELKDLIESGQIKPIVGRTYPLSRTAEALEQVGHGHSKGKVVITA